MRDDWVAALDQTMAGAKDFAKVVRSYYEGLRDSGFTDEQAMTLSLGYQTALITQLGNNEGEAGEQDG